MHAVDTESIPPSVRLFEEWIIKRVAVRKGDIIVGMRKPALPLWRNHMSVRCADRCVMVVLDPARLTTVQWPEVLVIFVPVLVHTDIDGILAVATYTMCVHDCLVASLIGHDGSIDFQ